MQTIDRHLYEIRHARACPGHPRLDSVAARKTWMAGHRRAEATPSFGRLCPAMTKKRILFKLPESIENARSCFGHTLRRADADGHPHPHQYPALGFCVAGLPDLAGLAIAAAENAADLADDDRALGVFSDGLVAAGHGARQGNPAASCVAGGGSLVCLAGAFP